MAPSHGDGRLLSEWPASHMDWLVRAALSALVSRCRGLHDLGGRAWPCLHAVFAATLQDRLLLYSYSVSDRHHSHCQLHVSELSGALAWRPAARRWLFAQPAAAAMERAVRAGLAQQCRASSQSPCTWAISDPTLPAADAPHARCLEP